MTIKAENKKRRKEGLDILKLPPVIKASQRGRDGKDDGMSLLQRSDDSDDWATKSGRTRKRARRGNDENLTYEGRECRSPVSPSVTNYRNRGDLVI